MTQSKVESCPSTIRALIDVRGSRGRESPLDVVKASICVTNWRMYASSKKCALCCFACRTKSASKSVNSICTLVDITLYTQIKTDVPAF